jgi:hypothetical protein
MAMKFLFFGWQASHLRGNPCRSISVGEGVRPRNGKHARQVVQRWVVPDLRTRRIFAGDCKDLAQNGSFSLRIKSVNVLTMKDKRTLLPITTGRKTQKRFV